MTSDKERVGIRERLLGWMGQRASDYLVWEHERDLARARATEAECPDCQMPESYCGCDRYRDEMDAAFAAGEEHAYERLRDNPHDF